jgi:hypothetical protein
LKLSLDCNGVDPSAASYYTTLTYFTQLELLVADDVDNVYSFVTTLRGLQTKLRHLEFAGGIIDDYMLSYLQVLTNLTKLSMDNFDSFVTPNGVRKLVAALPRLTALRVTVGDAITMNTIHDMQLKSGCNPWDMEVRVARHSGPAE